MRKADCALSTILSSESLESLEFLEILRLLKFENFLTMVRRNFGSAIVMALFYSESVIQYLPLLLVAAARDARHSFGFCYLSRWRPADNRPTAHKHRRGSNSIVKIGFDYPAI